MTSSARQKVKNKQAIFLKGTSNVISSDPLFKEGQRCFTKVLWKPLYLINIIICLA